jgi:hypothetical protein
MNIVTNESTHIKCINGFLSFLAQLRKTAISLFIRLSAHPNGRERLPQGMFRETSYLSFAMKSIDKF